MQIGVLSCYDRPFPCRSQSHVSARRRPGAMWPCNAHGSPEPFRGNGPHRTTTLPFDSFECGCNAGRTFETSSFMAACRASGGGILFRGPHAKQLSGSGTPINCGDYVFCCSAVRRSPRQCRRSRQGGSGFVHVRCDPGAILSLRLRRGRSPPTGFRPKTRLSIPRRVSILKGEFCPLISVDNGWCSMEKRLMGMLGGERGGGLPSLQGCSGLHRCIMFHCWGSSSRGFFGSYRSS
jgi:hypothetical protein